MARWSPDAIDNGELIRSGASTLAGGVAKKVESQRRVHPVLEAMLRQYGPALKDGTITAEEVHAKTAEALRLHNQQTAPVSPGSATGDVPVATPDQSDTPEKVVSVPSQQSPQYTGQQGMDAEVPASGGSMPAQAPGTGPSLATPMRQANGVASGMMGGQAQPPSVGRPASVGALAQGPSLAPEAPGPSLTKPRERKVPLYGDKDNPDRPFTSQDLEDSKTMAPIMSVAQKPELEKLKADAKTKAAKLTQDARKELEMYKQSGQNQRLVGRLDTMLTIAQGRLDSDGQQRVAHMAESLLNVEQKMEAVRELIAAKHLNKQGDWKVQMAIATASLKAALGRNAAMVAGSNNLIVDPKVQGMLEDAVTEQNVAGKTLLELENEIGTERDSPALINAGKPGEPGAPATEPKPVEVPNPAAPLVKTTDKPKKKPAKKTKKYTFNPTTGAMEEVK
jgi:hypothetical protein